MKDEQSTAAALDRSHRCHKYRDDLIRLDHERLESFILQRSSFKQAAGALPALTISASTRSSSQYIVSSSSCKAPSYLLINSASERIAKRVHRSSFSVHRSNKRLEPFPL